MSFFTTHSDILIPMSLQPLIYSARSNTLGLKYKSFTSSGCKDKGIINIKFVAKTQLLYHFFESTFISIYDIQIYICWSLYLYISIYPLTISHDPYPNLNLMTFTSICLFRSRCRTEVRRKVLSFCHKLKFSNPLLFATWWCKPTIFKT